jgi:hypothetical protein
LPKVSSFNSSNLPLTNISNDNKPNTFVQSSVKLLNQKQIVHFEIQTNATNQKCDFLLREIFQLMSKQTSLKTKWLCYSE